jgi:1,4-dihydroxy-6-naphthoate synthase
MQLTLGFSPCPNDTFIFYGLLNQKVDAGGIEWRPVIEDVQALNEMALRCELDVTKMSFAAFASLQTHYSLLDSGSALGSNCGPLVISRHPLSVDLIRECSVALPGSNTTAHYLFERYFPGNRRKKQLIFSEIETAVLDGVAEAGVIIHENRFTYEKKGLHKVVDLGLLWEQETGLPIPLGGIFMKRDYSHELMQRVTGAIRESVRYAMAHPDEAMAFVRTYSQEMDEEVMWQHIRLYVNDFSISLGESGNAAVRRFLNEAGK